MSVKAKGGNLQVLLETDDLLLKKAEFEDWQAMYRNVWSRQETAVFMTWRLTTNEEDAKDRMQKTIKYQENHDTYLVYEKKSGQAIGFAGVEETMPHIYQDASIALGPNMWERGMESRFYSCCWNIAVHWEERNFIIPHVQIMKPQKLWHCPAVLHINMQKIRQICGMENRMNWKFGIKKYKYGAYDTIHTVSLMCD